MFPPKKKPAFGGPKPDLSGPGPIDKMPAKKPAPVEPVDDEASEAPEEESAEESGGSLISDMVSPLTEAGMDESTAKEALCGVLLAICGHLRGDGVAQHDAGGADMEGDTGEDYGR
jgi:hypothetical protein